MTTSNTQVKPLVDALQAAKFPEQSVWGPMGAQIADAIRREQEEERREAEAARAKKEAAEAKFRNTGWGGCSHYKPTLGEMVESSREAANTYRARIEAEPDCPVHAEGLKKTLFDLAMYEILAGRFGAQTKLFRVSGREIAEAKVAAFLRMTGQDDDGSDPFPPHQAPDPDRARRIVCNDGISRPFGLARGGAKR